MFDLNLLKQGIVRGVSYSGLVLKKYAPELLLGTGIISGMGTLYTACRATLLADKEVVKIKEDIEEIKTRADMEEKARIEEITSRYGYGLLALVKIYALSIALGSVSLGSILLSHGMLKERLALISAAYAQVIAVTEFTRLARKTEKENKIIDDILGDDSEIPEDESGYKGNDGTTSVYAFVFGPQSTEWNTNHELNRFMLLASQSYMNDRLQQYGHLFLNEVYDALGLPHTKQGALVGWILGHGDGFVDLGIDDPRNNSTENDPFILDPNVAGTIWDLI